MRNNNNKNKILRKIISIILVVAIVLDLAPVDGLFEGIIKFDFPTKKSMSSKNVCAASPDDYPGNFQSFSTIRSYMDFCELYQLNSEFAAEHQYDTLDIVMGADTQQDRDILTDDYVGLGTLDYPFGGVIMVPDVSQGFYEFTNNGDSFFYCVYDSVRIKSDTLGTDVDVLLMFKRTNGYVADETSFPILAQYVKPNPIGAPSANWNIKLSQNNTSEYSGVIGEICEGAYVNLNFANMSGTDVVSNALSDSTYYVADVGAVCGKIDSGATLNLNLNEISSKYSITSQYGNAGGIVGSMEGTATLNIIDMPAASNSKSVYSNGTEDGFGYAGGLVGKITSSATISLVTIDNGVIDTESGGKVGGVAATVIPVGGYVTSAEKGAGGLFGYYGNVTSGNTFDVAKYSNSTVVYGKYCGGLFGVLKNNMVGNPAVANTFTITDSGTTGFASTSGTGDKDTTAFFGGIAGIYKTDDLTNCLAIQNISISSTSSDSFAAFGGAIGLVDSAAYVYSDGVSISATGTNLRNDYADLTSYAYFGGLIGATSTTSGVFVDLGDFTLTTSENFKGGGVVGTFNNGVLRLSGTTDMLGSMPEGNYLTNADDSARQGYYGQIVGYNDNVLVYALGNGLTDANTADYQNGWRYVRSNGAVSDDLGTWGQVVRLFKVGESNLDAQSAEIVSFDSTAHTVTLSGAITSMGSTVDFAKTALNIMLNQGVDYDCLKFTAGSEGNEAVNQRDSLLTGTLEFTQDISLANTGINGFMRDGSTSISATDIGGVGVFTGTVNGESKTITLSIGDDYGVCSNGQTEGKGQIYRHRYNGLFSVIGNGTTTCTINNLTVSGNINIHNAGTNGLSIGGIAARSHGSSVLDGITASQTVNYYENRDSSGASGDWGKHIGGLIGYVDNNDDNGTIDFKGNINLDSSFVFTGKLKNWMTCGGAIGNVSSSKVVINFGQNSGDSCTVTMTTDDSGLATGGADSATNFGGLIGYIHTNGKYANKKVNISNTTIGTASKACTLKNSCTDRAGGVLGHSWYNTEVSIDGLTVENCTLNYNATNVGVMAYNASGIWNVESLTVNKLTMSSGAGTSLGMLVNKAYRLNGDNYDGLYLNVLNSGYTLIDKTGNTGIVLPETLGIYDEIAAYSAENQAALLKGNVGVISINMNSNREGTNTRISSRDDGGTTITGTGTYQNKLSNASTALGSAKYANGYSRYYYNLDKMSTSDAGEKLLLWSVNKYAASNIKGEFSVSGNPFSGTADMTGLSFYPIYNADNTEIGTLSLKLDYSGIYSSAESIFNSPAVDDGYLRDPGAVNQHYLMHSGLFINLPTGKTINLTGTLTLSGNFLELNNYSGVLVSDTMFGGITSSDNSSIILDGITPRTTGNATYNNGYLLVNKVTRDDSSTTAPTISIKNLSTTKAYSTATYDASSTNSQVARSLFGVAHGRGLNIDFSGIKLDGRNGTVSDSNLLATAQSLYEKYGTYKSIFSNATFFESIKTDQSAQLIYNFTYDEDWGDGTPRKVTYGKEISESKEHHDKEHWYYSPRRYVNPVNGSDTIYSFSTSFLPYVGEEYTGVKDVNDNLLYYRELTVNVVAEGLTDGCGTYNDPYKITTTAQLEAVAKFIYTGIPSNLGNIRLPKNKDSYDTLAENVKGNRWCDNNDHTDFKVNGDSGFTPIDTNVNVSDWDKTSVQYYLANAYYVINRDITLTTDFVGLGGNESNTAFRGVIVGVKNANGSPKYTITNKSDKPFIRVSNGCVVKDINIIVDSGNNIELEQANAGYNNAFFGYNFDDTNNTCKYYGGIIGEIMGGDNIIDNSYVQYSYKDSSNVDHNTKITLKGKYGTIVPVGGYVGVIVFGGLVFKNIITNEALDKTSTLNVVYTEKTDNLADESKQSAWAAIYVNPYVGRVINGYAVNETETNSIKGTTGRFSITENGKYHDDDKTSRTGDLHSLKNGTKHYSIADVNLSETDKLTVAPPSSASSDGTISIPNSQAFFILSLITQSCAGTSQSANGVYSNSLSYGTYNSNNVYGMSHNAEYTSVGSADNTDDADYQKAAKDTANNSTNDYAVPYIIKYYTQADSSGNYPARCVTSTKGYYDINLTEGENYVLPDSFRGLGSIGKYNSDNGNNGRNNVYSIKLDVFDGNGCVIDEDIYMNKFKTDNYFNTLHGGTNQNISTNCQSPNGNNNTLNHGIGLFDTVIMKNSNSKISDFTIRGSVRTAVFNNIYSTSKQELHEKAVEMLWLAVAGVCGWSTNINVNLSFENINLNGLSVCGTNQIGGLLGYSGLKSNTAWVNIRQCKADDISVKATASTNVGDARQARCGIGSFVGKVQEGAVYIYGTSTDENNSNLSDFSEVKINKFEFSKDKNNKEFDYNMAAGGLVGFCGNGCRIYDMRVTSKDTTITVGGNNIRFAGGVVGGMQSFAENERSGIAVFKNCVVNNINVNGNFAGGYYGGKWDSNWTTYSLTFDNCKLLGSSTSHNSVYANDLFGNASTGTTANYIGYGGGFVGSLYPYSNKDESNKVTHNVLIKDCVVSNYDITASNKATSYVGGFIGNANSAKDSVTCYIHDSSIEDCIIGANGNYAGGIIGRIDQKDNNQILGYNIKLDTITTNSGNKMGAWIGYAPNDTSSKKTSIQFTGMAIYGQGFTKNIGNNASIGTASFVFADYTGNCQGAIEEGGTERTYPDDFSSFNATNNVEMPKYPYVNINPQSSMGTDEFISSDAAVLYKDNVSGITGTGKNTMAAKIYVDLSDSSNTRRYTTYSDDDVYDSHKINYYMNRTTSDDGDRISTYMTERGTKPDNVDDFAVVVIANTENVETKNLINRYIQLVTNTTTDYVGNDSSNDYYDLVINTCRYNHTSKSFEIVTDSSDPDYAPGLTCSGGVCALDGSHADSGKTDTFTLVDVQFKDPFNTNNVAYHLYVPVFTIKQMMYDFHTTAITGTNSVAYDSTGAITQSDYEDLLSENGKLHVDSVKTWITQYVRFTYKEADINSLLSSGNLDWNFNKSMSYETLQGGTKLPNDTYMILVDPNGNADKYYQASASNFEVISVANRDSWKIDFSKFKDIGGNDFSSGNFGDILSGKIKRYDNTGLGKYNRIVTEGDVPPDEYTLCYINNGIKEYYTYVAEGTGDYDFEVEDDVNEDYYISFWVPDSASNQAGNSPLYYYYVNPELTLSGKKTAKLDQKYTLNILVADLYEQDTHLLYEVKPGDQQITESNKEISVKAATTIKLTNNNAASFLSNTKLYHSFNIVLNRYSNDGSVKSDIQALESSNITALYGITTGEYNPTSDIPSLTPTVEKTGNYINIMTQDIMNALRSSQSVTIYTDVSMDFTQSELGMEFPEKNSADETIGVNVATSSNLAYEQARLAYTSMREPFAQDNHYYYVESVNAAMLNYYAVNELDRYDFDGMQSQNMSRLGVNGRSSTKTMMPINTKADYNVGILDDWSDGDKIRLTLTLDKKVDKYDLVNPGIIIGADYEERNSISDYLTFTSIKSGNVTFVKNNDLSTAGKYVYEANSNGCSMTDGYYHFDIAFDVKTGTGFREYSNYKVDLQAELINTEKGIPIENSKIKDYVVYTNAKVYSEVINTGEVESGNGGGD